MSFWVSDAGTGIFPIRSSKTLLHIVFMNVNRSYLSVAGNTEMDS